MVYEYDIEQIKNSLTIEQVSEILRDFHADPVEKNGGIIVCKTICHHHISDLDNAGYKLYYYDNTKLFHCYTGCAEATYDIFELVRKVKTLERGIEWQLPQAVRIVAEYFGFSPNVRTTGEDTEMVSDWKVIANYERIKNIDIEKKEVELKTYNGDFLKNFPKPLFLPWAQEGITKEVCDNKNICFDPKNMGIIIPHYDINNNLIGIRERTIVEENEKYGKYRPAVLCKKMYNHPLGFNLYNLNNSKDNIKEMKKAFVFESEKSCLQYASYFGIENDISVAVCGSSFSTFQAQLLIDLGVQEIIIGFDKQFQEKGDNEFKKLTRNLENIYHKYGSFVTISYLFDKDDLLGYKSSPTDEGKEKFLELYRKRVFLE